MVIAILCIGVATKEYSLTNLIVKDTCFIAAFCGLNPVEYDVEMK